MFVNLLIILAASLLVIAAFRPFKLPPLLGYMTVGLALGPGGLGWVEQHEDLPLLAEFGVVFLLFSLGLEFSLPRMLALRKVVFGLGSLQVIACSLPLAGLLTLAGLDLPAALLLGGGLALSSTAIVTKELSSLGEVFSPHGQNAIGVLLFQDLVAVLLLTMIPVIAGDSEQVWYFALPITLGKAALLFAALLVASRWLLPRLFHEVAQANAAELFVLLALVIVMLTAWLTHLLGLSMALGAFLAGMLLGESHYRHQIEADIRPFRDVLLGLFFVSVGMFIDVGQFASDGLLILGMTLLLLLLKGGAVAVLVRLRGGDTESAWRSGLALAQGGEFCFALVAQAQQVDLLPAELGGLVLAATFCSMAVTPLLLRNAPRIAARLGQHPLAESNAEDIASACAGHDQHVLICGFGRVGQSIGRFLRREGIPFVALDSDPVRVQEAAAGEINVHYGDGRRGELLAALGVARARLLVVAADNPESALETVRQARKFSATLPILVRTRDDSYLASLQAAGATEVVPEVLESSLMLASHALVMLGLPERRVQARIDEVRSDRYHLLHGFYHGASGSLLDQQGRPRILLHAVNLSSGAHACGRSVLDMALDGLGVEVQAIRRDGEELHASDNPFLREGDALLLAGPLDAIEKAEAKLLAGL
ncbi:monovalent cation:proton antiporter family protein [Pseudomonas oryzae]|uniref:Kef-type potassium/proton antiporter, CPA2 family n=1 Tax=Pseudomonas oryzae TaxID=1392877 RepID=A0A1H1UI41_9PSED|nr:monovalent cation:proton antiporter family protein [Pseudomonas oryzae]SDS72128.1 Kef-type potassium/proton antiporter, CPA2 family [Pseudomonas oryzae]